MGRRSAVGATLIELIVCLGIFMLALTGIFLLFRAGYQSFHFLRERQGLQVEMLRLKTLLQADFELSHLRSVSVGTNEVSCLILDDWREGANYHPRTNIPRWNRYALYSTRGQETALYRSVLGSGSELPLKPLADRKSLALTQRQLLTENLVSLRGEIRPDTQDLTLEIVLRKDSGPRGSGLKRGAETFEGVFRFAPANTQPKL